jgi:uncharacterized protein (DUF4415 family)
LEKTKGRGRPPSDLRIDADVIEHFRATDAD